MEKIVLSHERKKGNLKDKERIYVSTEAFVFAALGDKNIP